MTGDPRIFFQLAREFKSRDIPFISLHVHEPIPSNVGVILTTGTESGWIDFPCKVIVNDGKKMEEGATDKEITTAVERTLLLLKGREKPQFLTIGIDPGLITGVVAVCDGVLMDTYKCRTPGEVRDRVKHILSTRDCIINTIKVGHQARTFRNQIVNHLLEIKEEFDFTLKIVDETSTTNTKRDPHTNAALEISTMDGREIEYPLPVKPTEGELRDIQRMSRIKSDSRVTISRELALRVALGELLIDQAIRIKEKLLTQK